ncbi:MAG: hypothetical protein U0230_20760 [Polyangiales bacterium]
MRIASWALLAPLAFVAGCGYVGYEHVSALVGDAGGSDGGASDAAGDAGATDGGAMPHAFRDLCAIGNGLVVQDGVPTDDTAGADMGSSLASACGSFPTTSAMQNKPGVLEPSTGRPIGGPGSLYLVGGGETIQNAIAYLQANDTPLTVSRSGNQYILTSRSTGQVVLSVDATTLDASHDLALIQVVREPRSGTVVLNAYGYYETGTKAGAFYFATQIAPSLATDANAYYVILWTDGNGDTMPNAGDTFMLVGSGT